MSTDEAAPPSIPLAKELKPKGQVSTLTQTKEKAESISSLKKQA